MGGGGAPFLPQNSHFYHGQYSLLGRKGKKMVGMYVLVLLCQDQEVQNLYFWTDLHDSNSFLSDVVICSK